MKIPKITQEEIGIIKKAQAGDQLAFSELYHRYKEFVEKILYGYIKDKDEANDIANAVFVKVYCKLSTFRDYSSFGGWLRVMTNRTAIDYLRSAALRKLSLSSDEWRLQYPEPSNSKEDDLINRMTYEQIVSDIKKLPPKARQINEMYYINNMTIEAISEVMQVPEGTIKSALFRTRNKLKKKYKKQ